jgi:sugar lactone lactonase YvrE
MKWIGRIGLVVLGLLLAIAITLYVRYGGGEPYADLSTAPLQPEGDLEVVLSYPEPIGNVAVGRDGRVFFTVHPESRPTGAKLLVFENGKIRPFPATEAQGLFDTVLGVAIDPTGRLWTIDPGAHGMHAVRLLAFDTTSGEIVHDYTFPRSVAPRGSFVQDLQVDSRGEWVYLADVSFWGKRPGIIVYDVRNRSARRVLDRHASVMPLDYVVRNPVKDMVFFGGLVTLKPGVDGIAISRDDQWLYYAAMTGDTLYRIETAALKDAALSAAQLATRVQAVGKKPLNDGLSTDLAGNVYITDVEHSGVARMSPQGRLETVIRSNRIRWADALSYGPDGYQYIADSAIPDQMLQSKAHMRERAPYFIFRYRPGIDGVPGQ